MKHLATVQTLDTGSHYTDRSSNTIEIVCETDLGELCSTNPLLMDDIVLNEQHSTVDLKVILRNISNPIYFQCLLGEQIKDTKLSGWSPHLATQDLLRSFIGRARDIFLTLTTAPTETERINRNKEIALYYWLCRDLSKGNIPFVEKYDLSLYTKMTSGQINDACTEIAKDIHFRNPASRIRREELDELYFEILWAT